ncbi:FIST N-terminal domain-containing protein [Dendrosporobacter sp. 1207_IL3150]|uniref:FIST N-terminal domain-containing protein n=1 Tax=Dendrosporobacter sp. 1207_IL3150 TaxID=3084054 RepID=UPI002FD9F74F
MKTLSLFYENFTSLSRFIQDNCEIFLNPNNSAILVQLFSSRCEQSFYKELLHEIIELIPTAVIIGTTSSGVIKDGEVSGVDTVISFSIFQKTNIRTAIYRKDVDEHKLGQIIAKDMVTDRTKLLMMFTTSGNLNVSHLLHGIQSIRKALPMAGGVAGNAHLGKSFVFDNSEIEDLGVVCAVLESDDY